MACISAKTYTELADEVLIPQINRTVKQITQLLPQLQENEEALRDVYDQMRESRKNIMGWPSSAFSTELPSLKEAGSLMT